jgi:histidinol-phosphate aminotransferase
MKLFRKNILNIVSYVAGKPIEETKRQLGLKEVIKLASNENSLGSSPKAIKAIRNTLFSVNRYPDSQSFYLKRRIAKFYNIEPECVVLGNGSDELIDIIIKTFVEDNENIVISDTTFLEYEIIASINAKQVIRVPLKYFKYDLSEIKKRINRKTKLVFIANPNNPTGTYVNKYELQDFLSDLNEDVIVVLDEAYDTFIDVDDFPNSLTYLKKKNIIILKTFSKAYGLAGLRIGFAITNSDFAYYMEKVRQPFNVNILAQAAAMAALDDNIFLKKTKKVVLEGKDYLYQELMKLGIPFVPSVANFILIDVGGDCLKVFRQMLKYGVIVRDMKQYGLNNFIRVTIGTKRENEKFIKTLRKII